MLAGDTPFSIKLAILLVKTFVLPDPDPITDNPTEPITDDNTDNQNP